MRFSCLMYLVVLYSFPVFALEPSGYFSDHMVLQRNKVNRVWGSQASPGEKITVIIDKQKAECVASEQGDWIVNLPIMDKGGPYALVIKGDEEEYRFDDVMVGEVWLCGGQSNMEWSVKRSANHEEEIANADHPWLRLGSLRHQYSDKPADQITTKWMVCSPETIGDFAATAYYFGRELKSLDCAVAVVDIAWGGTPVEAWTPRPALEKIESFSYRLNYTDKLIEDYETNEKQYNYAKALHTKNIAKAKNILGIPSVYTPKGDERVYRKRWASGLYNGMIYPIRHVAFKGIAFYQGETNYGRGVQYRDLFPAMIREWRKTFQENDFPFIFVQLAGYQVTKEIPYPSDIAELREAQTYGLNEPNTAMVTAIDIGNRRYIHPTNKQEVGRRISLAAFNLAYDSKVVYRGPQLDNFKFDGSQVVINVQKGSEGELLLLGDSLKTFCVAGEDKKFFWANMRIHDDQIILNSPFVEKPVAFRYNWADYPLGYLYNSEGLPAEPFRSDDWPVLSTNRW